MALIAADRREDVRNDHGPLRVENHVLQRLVDAIAAAEGNYCVEDPAVCNVSHAGEEVRGPLSGICLAQPAEPGSGMAAELEDYMFMKKALVCGAGGFIGSHLVQRLKNEGYWVRGADLKYPEFSQTAADDFVIADLRDIRSWETILDINFDEAYQLAADMGGAGYIFTGENDSHVMHNSAMINLHMADFGAKKRVNRVFYSSSACIYPAYNQLSPDSPNCEEDTAYPAAPDSEYGWEKLFSERLYRAFSRNQGLDVRIARFHNIFGPRGTWQGGREKAPAALCRKVAEQPDGGEIEIWGDGRQTRSFLYIDECVEGVRRLMSSSFPGPVNIGSEEMVSINQLAGMVMETAKKKLTVRHIPGPLGVRGRNSDNKLIREELGWEPSARLFEGLSTTYAWIEARVQAAKPMPMAAIR